MAREITKSHLCLPYFCGKNAQHLPAERVSPALLLHGGYWLQVTFLDIMSLGLQMELKISHKLMVML